MYVVVQENSYGHESGYTVEDVYGPFDKDAAHAFAEKRNAEGLYAVEFTVRPLSAA